MSNCKLQKAVISELGLIDKELVQKDYTIDKLRLYNLSKLVKFSPKNCKEANPRLIVDNTNNKIPKLWTDIIKHKEYIIRTYLILISFSKQIDEYKVLLKQYNRK